MADWKDQLREANYGGAAFGVRSHDRSGGRRIGVHTFVLRDTPFVEELGRQVRRFAIEGYIVGDDYTRNRDRLLGRLEGQSPNAPFSPGRLLIHPTYGALRVVCESFSVRETTAEGRMARFTMNFVEAGVAANPSARGTLVGTIDRNATAQNVAAGDQVVDDMNTVGVPEAVRESAANKLRELANRLNSLDIFTGPAAEVAALQDDITQLLATASTLATAPASLVASVQTTLGRIIAATSNAAGALFAYESLFDIAPTLTGGTGANDIAADENSTLVSNLIGQASVVGAGRAAGRSSFTTQEEASATRTRLSERMDALAGYLSDDAFQALEEVRGAVTNAVPPPGVDLPRLKTIRLQTELPALVLGFDIYGVNTRDAEIVSRNRIRHPLRIPGHNALEVLSS